jgi:hypothetical protein
MMSEALGLVSLRSSGHRTAEPAVSIALNEAIRWGLFQLEFPGHLCY